MKLVLSLAATILLAGSAKAQDFKAPPTAPFTQAGLLNKFQPQLEQIFQFTFDGAKLKLDRKGWGDAPKVAPKVNVVNFNNGPPIETLFNQMRSQAGGLTSSGMSVSQRHREINFSGNALSGRMRTSGDQVRMELEEGQAPQRALEWSDDGQGAVRLMLSNQDGDLILLQQSKTGMATVAGVVGGKAFAASGPSFLAMYKQNREVFDGQVLPAFGALSIRLIPSPATPEMKRAVLALLTRTPQSLEEGKKLLLDLDSEKFQTRDKASKLLNERFEVYKDLIQEKLKDSSISQEVASRLNKVLAAHPDAQKVSQTIAALDLLRDPEYLVGLLQDASPAEQAKVVAQLETVTGRRLGVDVAGWKAWLQKKK